MTFVALALVSVSKAKVCLEEFNFRYIWITVHELVLLWQIVTLAKHIKHLTSYLEWTKDSLLITSVELKFISNYTNWDVKIRATEI